MSFPRYPAYKDSGVEWLAEVPEHWKRLRLRFAAMLNPSKQEARLIGEKEIVSFLPMEAIGEDGSLSLEQEKEVGECLNGYTYFTEGDVCIAKITPCFENGKGAILRGLKGGVGFGTTELIVARPRPEKLTAEFLDYVFRSNTFRSLGESAMYGAGGQKRVPDSFVRDFASFLPPISEQSAIATFLNRETAKIDALIAEQQHLIELLQEKRQAVISQAVTKGLNPDAPMKDSGVEWLGEVPEHWTVCSFRRFTRIAEGQVDPRIEPYARMLLIAPNHIEARTGLLTCLETANEQGAESGKYLCKAGDVIYSKIRPALRKACIAPQDCLTSADMYPLMTSECLSPGFLLFFLLSEEFSALAVLESERVAMPKINREALGAVPMAFPPRAEQADICRYITEATNGIDELTNQAASSIHLLQERRSALISAAVTGQIDVRGLVPEVSS